MKIKKINLAQGDFFNLSKYDGPGVYEVNKTDIHIVKKDGIIWALGSKDSFPDVESIEEKPSVNLGVSEAFALKMLAVAMNNHESLAKL